MAVSTQIVRAVGITAKGGTEVLQLVERPVREPGPGEVRIAVRAAAVNPTDIGMREMGGGDLPAPWVPGMDAAGTVESIGAGVSRLTPGDEVMAAVTPRREEGGAQQELLVVPEASAVPIPENATVEEAATLPMNGLTAIYGLELLCLADGQTLGVTGGAGLLASYVIALAKERGLTVIADAKPEDEELVRSYGADQTVPRGAFADRSVDGMYDTALLHDAVFPAIRDGGRIVVVRGWRPETEPERGIEVKRVWVGKVLERTDWLTELKRMVVEGRITLRVAGTYAADEAAEAHRIMDAGGLRGRMLIVF